MSTGQQCDHVWVAGTTGVFCARCDQKRVLPTPHLRWAINKSTGEKVLQQLYDDDEWRLVEESEVWV